MGSSQPLHKPQQHQIFLEETDTEYHLYIHYTQKSRAAGIQGRRWDPERVCWVYPKSARSHNALLAEFGSDIKGHSSPSVDSSQGVRRAADGHSELKAEIAHLKTVIESRLNKDATSAHLVERLREAEAALQKEKDRASERDVEFEQALVRNRKLIDTIKKLEANRQGGVTNSPDSQANESPGPDDRVILKRSALAATGNDPVFEDLLASTALDARFPLLIADKLTFGLRRLVGDTFATAEFFDLIKEAERRQLLSPAAVNCAHVIRMQRNLLAHPGEGGDVDERSMIGRVALCLFAAAIVWPELPE